MTTQPKIRFAAIGLNHFHIYGQTNLLLRAGAELVSFYAEEADLAALYQKDYPQAQQVTDKRAILEDASLQLVISAAIPSERAALGMDVMRHGKDYMSDKPGFTTLDQLAEVRRVQQETGRIYSIDYSERLETRASVKAAALVQSGAIGQVIQTIGLGPHRPRLQQRPWWFFKQDKYGGIICDIASHQFEQYLFYTGETEVEVVHAQVANYAHPEYPEFEDFGDVVVRGKHSTGYVRVDWFTPDGLATWGDGRIVIMGTDGYIELRKYIDIAGRPGTDHLFLVNKEKTEYIDCKDQELPYGRQLINDILNRTETAMSQEHCFRASELALTAQAKAMRLGHLR
ncbi:MAG: Gfo/Idh/MocA family oxidoreductase [Caldilineaceae bacterium]|nr:Gfo/Idh/MocA family oxidoreductase [Caldilineaceae bacterium]